MKVRQFRSDFQMLNTRPILTILTQVRNSVVECRMEKEAMQRYEVRRLTKRRDTARTWEGGSP